MSIAALNYAFGRHLFRATDKLVLIALANYANDEAQCYPSHLSLAKITSLDRKTIIDSIQRLEQMGVLRDTGVRKGRTARVVVYELPEVARANSPKNGIVPFFPGNSPENGTQNHQGTTEGYSGLGDTTRGSNTTKGVAK